MPIGKCHGLSVLTDDSVVLARKLRNRGMTYAAIGKRLGASNDAVRKAVLGLTWKHVGSGSADRDLANQALEGGWTVYAAGKERESWVWTTPRGVVYRGAVAVSYCVPGDGSNEPAVCESLLDHIREWQAGLEQECYALPPLCPSRAELQRA
jgi:hypothetical protein